MTRDHLATLYLDLMRKCLTGTLEDGPELVEVKPREWLRVRIARALAAAGFALVRKRTDLRELRARGLDNNPRSDTMIGLARLDNIRACVERVLADGVPGDLIEAGVWRGGAAVFMRAVLAAHGIGDRTVWVADSFAGLPPPDESAYPADRGDRHHEHDWLAVTLDDVKGTFRKYGLLDGQVRFLEGWFKDTLPGAPIERLAVIRMDGLAALYPRLSIGGYVILDDWNLIPACRRAIDDFRAREGIVEPVLPVDGNAGYWRRER
jgi:O-methyltransferase